MDCEKFESALMDELYGELDELSSAAAKRHVSGCARCAALLSGLRATRRVATLPRVAPPEGLEQRILAAAAAATPNVVPLRGRVAKAISLAGSWAMRPQTAMAAVFLVMIGTSVLFLRGKSSRAPASAEMTVTEEGTPAPAGPPAADSPAPAKPSPAAGEPAFASAAPVARPSDKAAPAIAPAAPAATLADALDDVRRGVSRAKGEDGTGSLALNAAAHSASAGGGAVVASGPAVAAAPRPMAYLPPAQQAAAAPAGAFAAPPAAEAEVPATAPAPTDPADELWSARTARDAAARQGRACPSGARFDDVASRAPGTQQGWDALYEGALCYESMGDYGSARTRLGTLLGVPSYRDRARMTIERINKEQQGGPGAAGAARAAPKAAAAPPPAAAPPADAKDSAH
jgi:hypothetical protein